MPFPTQHFSTHGEVYQHQSLEKTMNYVELNNANNAISKREFDKHVTTKIVKNTLQMVTKYTKYKNRNRVPIGQGTTL
jgi:hypothetical protein